MEEPRQVDAVAHIGLQLLIDTFCARTDAYVSNSRAHVGEPLTVKVLVDAYVNKQAISGYTANGDLTRVGALDFDHTDERDIGRIWDTLDLLGVKAIRANSRRGAHLWVSVGQGDGKEGSVQYGDVPAASVRRALEHAIRLTDEKLLAGVEVFPKVSTSPWGVGALRLPLMTHPKTKQRYPVLTRDGQRLTKLVDVLTCFEETPWSVIAGLSRQAPVEYPRDLGQYRRTRRGSTEAVPASAQLQSIGATNAQPGHSIRCPFHDDKKASMSIAPDDERVWCKSPGCDAYNGGRGVGSLALAKMIERREK